MTAQLLRCAAAAIDSGKRLAPSRQSAHSAVKVLAEMPDYPKGLDARRAQSLLEGAERAGTLALTERIAGGHRYLEWSLPSPTRIAA